MISVAKTSNGIYLPKAAIYISLLTGLGIILLVGLLCGLVARPNNCIQRTTLIESTKSTSMTYLSSTPNSIPSTTLTKATSSTPATIANSSVSTSSQSTVTRTIPTISTLSTSFTQTTTPIQENIRLPNYQIPTNYKLDLKVYFDPIGISANQSDGFEGTVVIDLKLNKSTKKLVLHAANTLKIKDTIEIINLSNGNLIKVREEQHSFVENQLYEITLDQELPSGDYKLKIDYNGDFGLPTNIIGFYKTRYFEDGVTKNLVATKFQPTDARKAFPCFDEPALKATFEITIEHPLKTIALSNWPESSKQMISGNRYLTKFEKTYPMSTYLAAWTVLPDDYGFLQAESARGKKIRVFARKEATQNGLIGYALEIAKKALDFFENEYFEPNLEAVPPKIDMIGFPDFPSGAMEHWGLIGYRETSLLYNESRNSLSNKQNVAFVVAHELSHFWFGNLVTCKWWNDLWLNEAMARFLQFKAIQKIHPDWDVENQFLTLYQIPVMYDDGFKTSSPVSNDILTPAQINSAFGSITYDKGSSLLRMLESTVGENNFREGLINFLRANRYSSAVASDFYNSLSLPSEMNSITPQQYMENWLLEINYPEVAVLTEVNEGRTRIKFKQSRFLLSQEGLEDLNDTSSSNYKWYIYLKCKVGGTFGSGDQQHLIGDIKEFNYFLNDTDGYYDLDRRYTWIICNKDFKSFYVTDYLDSNFQALEYVLINQPDIFSIGDRANLIHVAYSLAYLGSKSYATAALLTNYLETYEKNYVPWRTFTWHMTKIASILEHRPGFVNLKEFGSSIVGGLIKNIDLWDDSGSHNDKLLKSSLIEFLCRMQDENCLKNSTVYFGIINSDYFSNPNQITNDLAPNLRASVYKYHIQNTYNYIDWFRIYDTYLLTFDPQEKSQLLNAISQTRLLWIIDTQLYELIKDDSNIRAQDFFTLLVAISRNPSGRHLAWYFIRYYWFEIVLKFGAGSRTLANSVKSICETFENRFLLDEMMTFFSTTSPGAGALQRLQAYDIVVHNIFWINDREPDINQNLFIPFKYSKKATNEIY